ncbi:MAG TPA: hypothetical protein VH877_13165 [Polyangia bacterium]|nr:hypothetical protein [Polyangia bacterium]
MTRDEATVSPLVAQPREEALRLESAQLVSKDGAHVRYVTWTFTRRVPRSLMASHVRVLVDGSPVPGELLAEPYADAPTFRYDLKGDVPLTAPITLRFDASVRSTDGQLLEPALLRSGTTSAPFEATLSIADMTGCGAHCWRTGRSPAVTPPSR